MAFRIPTSRGADLKARMTDERRVHFQSHGTKYGDKTGKSGSAAYAVALYRMIENKVEKAAFNSSVCKTEELAKDEKQTVEIRWTGRKCAPTTIRCGHYILEAGNACGAGDAHGRSTISSRRRARLRQTA